MNQADQGPRSRRKKVPGNISTSSDITCITTQGEGESVELLEKSGRPPKTQGQTGRSQPCRGVLGAGEAGA